MKLVLIRPFALILAVFFLNSCTYFSIKTEPISYDIDNKLNSYTKNKTEFTSALNISVKRVGSNSYLSSTAAGKKIIRDIRLIEPELLKLGIKSIDVNIYVSIINGDPGFECNCYLLIPEVLKRDIKVDWEINELDKKVVNTKSINYKSYSHIFLFPYTIYDTIVRSFKADLGTGIFFPTDRENAAAELNRQMVVEFVKNGNKFND